MTKKYAVVSKSEMKEMRKEKRQIQKILGIFVVVMLVIIGVFYLLGIMAMVYIIAFGLVAGLFIFFVYLGGTSEKKWISKEELVNEEEAIRQLEEDENKGLLVVEDENK